MAIRSLAQVSGLLGGAGWIARSFVTHDWLWWAGGVGVGLACVLLGGGLVSGSAPALRAFTALAFPMLVGSVWWVLRDTAGGPSPQLTDAGVGTFAVVAVTASWWRHRGGRRAGHRRGRRGIGGAHR